MDIPETISDAELRQVLTDAVKLYSKRVEETGAFPPPIDSERVTATEAVTTICEIMRAVEINMFDLNMWYGRAR
jgi:hypothetical protein